MEDDGLMIIGAKKSKEVKNNDKHELENCIMNFKKFALKENELVNKALLSSLSISGEIDKNFIRPLLWKTFLNVISINNKVEDWVSQVSKQRTDYKTKLKNLNALKKFSGDPLGGSNDSGWNSFFEENELKKIINLDVNRTYQDKDLFQNTKIKEMLVNILFIWSKENREISYKQGMNEILAVILFGLYPFYFKNTQKHSTETILNYIKTEREVRADQIYLYFHDEDELAADLFFLFDAIMNKGIKDLYDTNSTKKKDITSFKKYELFQQQWTDEDDNQNVLPLNKRCFLIIKEKLKVIDEELYSHFIKIDLNCAIFLQRWLKCIFNREFHPRDVIILWDAIITTDVNDNDSFPNEFYSFMFIDFIAVAMINYIREDLLRKDQNECFMRLFKYPPIESPVTLIRLAIQIKELLFKKKKKKDQSRTNIKLVVDKINTGNDPLLVTKSNSMGMEKEVSQNSNSNSNSIISSKKEENSKSITQNKNEDNTISMSKELSKNNFSINQEDANVKIVNRLEEIFKKYKTQLDNQDSADFESIIESLRSNLDE